MNILKFIFIFLIFIKLANSLENIESKKKMTALAEELRCMVCQNQSLLESDSELAKDLKSLIQEKFRKGETEKEIKEFLVERYGEFILFSPQLNIRNVLLWFSPLLSLLIISFIAYRKHLLSRNK